MRIKLCLGILLCLYVVRVLWGNFIFIFMYVNGEKRFFNYSVILSENYFEI